MEFPLFFQLGPFRLSAHLFFETLAFFLGFQYFIFLRKRTTDPIETEHRLLLIFAAAMGALIFSRLLGSLEDPRLFWSGEGGWLYYFQSKTIVGALLGGLFCVELAKWWMGVKRSSGDLFTFPLILGMIIGRIGCFTTGVYEPTYGIPSSLPWAMDLGDGVLRHPTALYEILFLLALWWIIRKWESKRPFQEGFRFQLFLASYLLYRFCIAFIQPGYRVPFLQLTSLQIACLLGLVYYIQIWFRFRTFKSISIKSP